MDFSMADSRNFSSPYSRFFVSNVDYHGSMGIWSKIKQGAKFIHSREAVEKIKRIILEESPEIAHLHNIYHQLTPSIIPVLKENGVKVILTLHDGKLICPSYLMLKKGGTCTACKGRYFWRPITKRCQGSLTEELLLLMEAYWHKWKGSYEAVDLFIAPSQFVADLVSMRIPKDKIQVLHNGISTDKFRPTYRDEGYALFFGRLSKEKGIETLLEAHRALRNIPILKVVGTGPVEDKLRREYPDAEFLGYNQGDDLNNIIANACFVVVPSEWYENCSMVVLEAMALGKPVIGSRIGGIPEQIADGETGLLFEMGNVGELAEKIKVLSENSDMRTRMGIAARKKVEHEYSLDVHCSTLLKMYEELLSKN